MEVTKLEVTALENKKLKPHNGEMDDILTAVRIGIIEIEEAADIILESSGSLGRTQGIYTQTQLDRRIRLEREHDVCEPNLDKEMVDYLVERQVTDLIDAAGLTAIQEIIYRLHVSGFNVRNMAATLGIKRRTAASRLQAARRKIRAAYKEGKYAGWYEVYLSEVNRPAYRTRH